MTVQKKYPRQYRLEDDLLKKTRPKQGSARYERLNKALHAQQMAAYAAGKSPGFSRCERCGTMLLNPHSILLHQGGFCQKRIANSPDFNLADISQALFTQQSKKQ